MPRLKAFEKYVQGLEDIAGESLVSAILRSELNQQITLALDGGSSATLRKVVSSKVRQRLGAFFTPTALADQALDFFDQPIPKDALIMDCECGAGDLLLAAARRLPLSEDPISTVKQWGELLVGCDLQSEFVRATKVRLLLQAIALTDSEADQTISILDDCLPNIKVLDARKLVSEFERASHIVINPSFAREASPKQCVWAEDKVSAAAVILDLCVTHAKPSTQIVAILPDILRSGSNYHRWRKHISSRAKIEKIKVIGKFDAWTDADVFLLKLRVRLKSRKDGTAIWWKQRKGNRLKVGDLFEVEVGRVVPHRDPEDGPLNPYIFPKILPPWETIRSIDSERRFTGKTFEPPFVAIRRTSRSNDQFRAVGTIIRGDKKVAVENHLIVLTPKDGLLRTCRQLLDVLKLPKTNTWLNERIRARHLTVPAINEIHWLPKT